MPKFAFKSVTRLRRSVPLIRRIFLIGIVAASCFFISLVSAADSQPDRNAILGHLNAIINWYREAAATLQPGELPSDAIFQQNVRSLASEGVELAFASARAEAALLGNASGPSSEDTSGSTPSTPQNYSQIRERISQRISDNQSKLDTLNKQIPAQPTAKRQDLLAQQKSLSGQIELDKALLDAIDKMSAFVELSAVNKQGLEGSINDLANSIPEILVPAGSTGKVHKPSQTVSPTTTRTSGLIGQLVTLYDQVQSMRAINRLLAQNARVIQIVTNLRDPARDTVRSIIAQGQQELPQAAGANGTAPKDFSKLTAQFKQVAAVLLPLSQEMLVLQQSQSNLRQWRTSISNESKHDLIALLFRVFAIAISLGIVWGLADVWRRLTFRYVRDARRRRQFLTLRRFVMSFFFALVVVMGFVSEFGSLATYAGFVTAGIAVGLQTVLLSVAAYFFVVGRYGIRIGDRISVAGVTGDVVDVGLVRLYIMEMAGTGADLYPTGRIAVFSNSVLFQPTTPLYKQVPGTEYTWHEASMTIAATADREPIREKTLAAVTTIYNEHREILESQQGTIGDRMEIVLKAPAPEARFQLNDDGMALIIRYPVLLTKAAETDDRIAQALVDATTTLNDPSKPAVVGTPRIRAAVKG